jgi:DNA modification methylase
MLETNLLYYGDNLDILRRYIPDDSVDLIYLDPPFNSQRDYNVIFKSEAGRRSDAQLLAFEDTWHWGPSTEATYAYLTNTTRHQGRVPDPASSLVASLRKAIGENQMMAYLVEMAVRLVELHRTLKPTGSLYLHCDPTASHYLKVILDAIFGPTRFVNEVVWQRTSAHSDTAQGAKHFGRIADSLLFYSKGPDYAWNQPVVPHDDKYIKSHYPYVEEKTGRRYGHWDITGPGGAAKGNPFYEVMGVSKYWRYSKTNMEQKIAAGRIVQPSPGSVPREIRYLEDSPGTPVGTIWTDIPPINSQAKERLGYPTQKPIALLERIISSSSNPGDLILDPFCGCGTALIAAETLKRRWIGIDITYLAIAVMRARLKDSFAMETVPVVGQPTEVEGARQLAQSAEGRYQFQWWALGLVDAQPLGGVEKKGADRGIDGVITFTDKHGELTSVLVSVKSGHVNSSMVRDLKGAMDRDKAAIGVFLTLEEPSKEMHLEADTAGLWRSDVWKRDYPRIQIFTIEELLAGKKPQLPPFVMPTYQKAQRVAVQADQPGLFDLAPRLKKVAEPRPHDYVAENDS